MTQAERQALGRKAREIREEAKLSQRQLGIALGMPQSTISKFEAGNRVADQTLEAYVDLLKGQTARQLHEAYRSADDVTRQTAKQDAASKKAAEFQTPFAKEIVAFKKRNGMALADVSDVINIAPYTINNWIYRAALPAPEVMDAVRAAMAKYEGRKYVAQSKPVSDKPHTEAPKAPPKVEKVEKTYTELTPAIIKERVVQPDPAQVAVMEKLKAMAKVPTVAPAMTAVDTTGMFIANGSNVAPFLTLDGKTMHVFTVVPGGVYLSKLTAKENA